jgi:hypothetical protein
MEVFVEKAMLHIRGYMIIKVAVLVTKGARHMVVSITANWTRSFLVPVILIRVLPSQPAKPVLNMAPPIVIIPIIRTQVVLVKLLKTWAGGSIPTITKTTPAAMATGMLGIFGWKKQIKVTTKIMAPIITGDIEYSS